MRVSTRAHVVPDWAEDLNLMGPRVRTARWAWLLLCAGLAGLAWLWTVQQEVLQAQAAAQADVQRLQRALHHQQLAAQASARALARAALHPEAVPEAAAALRADQVARAAQLASWLAYPWPDTLRQADETAMQAQVWMLGFHLDLTGWSGQAQTRPWARMSAAVLDDVAALQWVQTLGSQAQLVSRQALAVPVDTARGRYQARAELAWGGAQP